MTTSQSQRRQWVREAFGAIAGRYDILNHVLSGGLHLWWKRAAVAAAHLRPGEVGLDLCCGTGDLVAGIARIVGPHGRAIGVDFAVGMLAVAASRTGAAGRDPHVHLVCADAEALPFGDATVHAATIAFGLRNVVVPERALRDIRRVLKPGGRVVILEFSRPPHRVWRMVYDLYSQAVIPRLGGWLSGRRDAYQYLHDSIRRWPEPDRLAASVRSCGFGDVEYRLLSGGIAALHVGVKH